jgi:hypothetical protein
MRRRRDGCRPALPPRPVAAGRGLPTREGPAVETARQRTLRVGARLERAALVLPPSPAAAPRARPITLGIDAGHVRSVRSYQVRSFETFVAQVDGAEDTSVVFASVPAKADRQQHQQLRRVLQGVGATASAPVTILSDGADGPRSLGEAASVGPAKHVADWFHLAMRIRHVAQAAKGWPADTPGDREDGAWFADAVEHIRWRLWHGQTQRALDLIEETLTWLEGMVETAPGAAAKDLSCLAPRGPG